MSPGHFDFEIAGAFCDIDSNVAHCPRADIIGSTRIALHQHQGGVSRLVGIVRHCRRVCGIRGRLLWWWKRCDHTS